MTDPNAIKVIGQDETTFEAILLDAAKAEFGDVFDNFLVSGYTRLLLKLWRMPLSYIAFMINRKIPRAWRDHVPLLVADGEIIWVCGCRAGAVGAIGPGTREVAQLRFDRAGTGTQGT